MFPIVPTHLMGASAAIRRQSTSNLTVSPAPTTSSAQSSGRNHSIWSMWNTSFIDQKASRTSKRHEPSQVSPIGCIAACNLPGNAYAVTGQILSSAAFEQSYSQPLRIGLSLNGQLCLQSDVDNNTTTTTSSHNNTWSWIAQIILAEDVHSNNLLAEIHRREDGRKELRVRTVCCINAGVSLRLWFDEEVAALIGVPFLAPANIRGKNTYTCQICAKSFENPNPLKMHMATNCDRRSQMELWFRVEHSINRDNLVAAALEARSLPMPSRSSTTSASPPITSSNISPPLPNHVSAWLAHHPPHQRNFLFHQQEQHQPLIDMRMIDKLQHQEQPTNQFRVSAFQPVTTKIANYNPNSLSPPHIHFLNQFPYTQLNPLFNQTSSHHLPHRLHHQSQLDHDSVNSAAAHLETIASNMGANSSSTTKPSTSNSGGHLCIYCGKVYSRKYGLKIHIRTHTGFKPLKCKYCFRPFGDPSNLNKHVRLHVQGSTIYKCPEPQCDKILVRRRDLQRHLQTRHAVMDADDGEQHSGEVEGGDDEEADVEVDVGQPDALNRGFSSPENDHKPDIARIQETMKRSRSKCRQQSSSPTSADSYVFDIDDDEDDGAQSHQDKIKKHNISRQ